MEVVDSVIFSQLNANFETRLEKIFKQLNLLRFPVERGHRCRELLWQFEKSVVIVMQSWRIVVDCQLLKGQQDLACSNRRRCICTVEVRLTTGAVTLQLS